MEVPSISSHLISSHLSHLINNHTICDTRLVSINSVGDSSSCIRGRLGVIILILQQQTHHMTTGGAVCELSSSNPN